MKKIFATLAALVLSAPLFAQFSSGGFKLDEEHLYYGVRFGITSATISGDTGAEASDSKVGMTLGGVVGIKLTSSAPVFLESGLYFTQRGGKGHGQDTRINYLEIPLLIKYGIQATDEIAVIPFFGPYFSYGFGGKTKVEGFKHSSFNDGYYEHPDMGFKLGCGAEYNNLYFELGYQIGVANISNTDNLTAHGNAFIANIGVNF